MWLSRQGKENSREQTAETGSVTLTGETVAVELDSERRGLKVYAPGGYRWKPTLEQKVLVLKTAEDTCIVGTPIKSEVAEGEVGLYTDTGTAVTLKQDGRIHMEPDVEIHGTLTVNGEDLETFIRRVVSEMAEKN